MLHDDREREWLGKQVPKKGGTNQRELKTDKFIILKGDDNRTSLFEHSKKVLCIETWDPWLALDTMGPVIIGGSVLIYKTITALAILIFGSALSSLLLIFN